MPKSPVRPWQPDSNKFASGKPGAVQGAVHLTVSDAFGDVLEIMLCQRARRTVARASAKVGIGFEYQLACRGKASSALQC